MMKVSQIGWFLLDLFLRMQRVASLKFRDVQDAWITRYYCKRFDVCGADIHFYYPCHITSPQHIDMGNNVHINRGAYIRSEGGLRIEDNVHIARNLTIYTVNHNYEGSLLPYDNVLVKKSVVIKKNVWIGINVTIIPGVAIGEGAIVGAGAVVSKDVPPFAIVGAQPLRIIGNRDEEHYNKLKSAKLYGGVSGRALRTAAPENMSTGDQI